MRYVLWLATFGLMASGFLLCMAIDALAHHHNIGAAAVDVVIAAGLFVFCAPFE